jgi:ABC-type glycerol-3-phosphate transport system substrate-binding protein
MKKAVCTIVFGLLVLSLVAAAGAREPAAAQQIEINYPSHYWGESTHVGFFTPLVAQFEAENPTIKVVGSNVPLSVYWDKTFAELMAGTPADIVNPLDTQLGQYIEAGFLEPLTPYLKAAGYDIDSFYPVIRAAVRNGEIYAVPYGLNPRVFMYNEEMFRAAGVPVPTTVDEFMTAVRRIRNPQTQTFGFATMATSAAPDMTYLEIMPTVAGFSRGFVVNGKANANAPETVAALQLLKNLYDERLIPIGQDFQVYRSMFSEERVAALTIGAFMRNVAGNANPAVRDRIQVAPLPFPTGNTISVNNYLAVPRDAKNKEAAIKFILKVLEDQWQPKITEFTGAIPARPGLVSSDFLRQNPWFQGVLDVTPNAFPFAPDGVGRHAPEVVQIIIRHYEAMLFNNVSAQVTGDNMQRELEAFLRANP